LCACFTIHRFTRELRVRVFASCTKRNDGQIILDRSDKSAVSVLCANVYYNVSAMVLTSRFGSNRKTELLMHDKTLPSVSPLSSCDCRAHCTPKTRTSRFSISSFYRTTFFFFVRKPFPHSVPKFLSVNLTILLISLIRHDPHVEYWFLNGDPLSTFQVVREPNALLQETGIAHRKYIIVTRFTRDEEEHAQGGRLKIDRLIVYGVRGPRFRKRAEKQWWALIGW